MITYKTFRRLDFNTRYFIRVRAKSGDKVGRWLEPPLDHTTMKRSEIPAPANVTLSFDAKDKDRQFRYRCVVSWDEVVLPFEKSNERDVDYYVVQLWRWDNDRGSFKDTEPIRTVKVEAKDSDADTRAKAVFFPVAAKGWFKARVRAVSENKRSDWSRFSPAGSPSDTDKPPPPINVRIYDNSLSSKNRIVVEWDFPVDTDDNDIPNQDISYFQIQLHTASNWTNLYKFDRYHLSTTKVFHIPDADEDKNFYARVRSVDASGNKSDWIPATSYGNSSLTSPPSKVAIGKAVAVPTGVVVSFGVRENLSRQEWRAIVRWNAVTSNIAGFPIKVDRYRVRLRATDASGVPVETDSGNPAIWRVIVDADDDLRAVFSPIARPRTWYYQASVSAGIRVAGEIRWGNWSSWTTPIQPTTGALPGPPAPTGLTLSMLRDESRRGEPWVAIATWNEVPTWTPPDGDPVDGAARYIVQLQVRRASDVVVVNTRRDTINARDDDSDTTASKVWHNISRKYEYRARVKAVDLYGRKGAWTAYTAWVRPPKLTGAVQNLQWKHRRPRVFVATWDPPAEADGVVDYRVRVYRGSPPGTLVETATTSDLRYRYEVPKADKGQPHYVAVRARYDDPTEESDDEAASGVVNEGDTSDYQYEEIDLAVFTVSGNVEAKHYPALWTASRDLRIRRVRCRVGRHDPATHPDDGCPQGAALIVQVYWHASDESSFQKLFANDNRLTIAQNTHKDAAWATDLNKTTIDEDEHLSVKVTQVGTTKPGSDLVVEVELVPR